MSTFHFFLDLRCPFCFVQAERLIARDTALPIVPQTVRHENPLPQPARALTADERQNLLAYFDRIAGVETPTGRTSLHIPQIWPNTGPASLAIAAAVRVSPAQAFRFALLLMRALWIEGRDVSSGMVINLVAHDAGLRRLIPTAADETTLRDWTTAWNARPADWRTPVLRSPRGGVMVGLGEAHRLDAFVRAGLLNSTDGNAC